MGTLAFITGNAVAQSGVSIYLRVRGNNGALITQASLATIFYVVSDLTAGTTGNTIAVAIATSVYDSLVQNNPRWTRDSSTSPGVDGTWGYNFLVTVPATSFPVSTLTPIADVPTPLESTIPKPHRYQVDVIFNPVTGEPFRVANLFTPQQVFG